MPRINTCRWDVETNIDVATFVKLQGGHAYVGYVGSGLIFSQNPARNEGPGSVPSPFIPLSDNRSYGRDLGCTSDLFSVYGEISVFFLFKFMLF